MSQPASIATKGTTKKETKAMTSKKPAITQTKKPAVKLADRQADLGDYRAGAAVQTADGRAWQVVGPAQGGTTLKLKRTLENGKTESVFRFARNIHPNS